MEETSLDVALDIVGTLRMMKIKKISEEKDETKKNILKKEVKMLLDEEKILYRYDKDPNGIRTSVMDKVNRLYSPILKNHYEKVGS